MRGQRTEYSKQQFHSGFTEEDFSLLSSITSWCTCGAGKPKKQLEEQVVAEHELDSPDQQLPPQLPQNIHPKDRCERCEDL